MCIRDSFIASCHFPYRKRGVLHKRAMEVTFITPVSYTHLIPVVGGHSEAVNIEFEKDFEIEDVIQLLSEFPGVVVYDLSLIHI